MRKMMNVSENGARNGVTDCPESRNEVSVEKRAKLPWGGFLFSSSFHLQPSTKPASTHEKSSSNSANLCFEASGTFRSHPETLKQVQIIFVSAELLQIRISSIASVACVSTALRHQVNGDITVRMHVTLMVTCDIISGEERWGCDRVVSEPQNSVYTAMADQVERYIYQRFPYVVLDDTPSSSSDSDSDPSEVSAATSQADIPLP
ncbi:hypothetical protein E3N88_08194 [Mikania micrantha]|uniref:Uncharacterized protein n=1 Tax=Mikania micrantha TaxID=192012 RepID=A0A5N6PFI6_9ASTR|nr:hypothetical protein E3N88_08194 [Mikania micrantha]